MASRDNIRRAVVDAGRRPFHRRPGRMRSGLGFASRAPGAPEAVIERYSSRGSRRILLIPAPIFGAAIAVLALGAVGAQAAGAAGPTLGRYQCYQTIRDVSPINGEVGYSTIFRTALTLRQHGLYEIGLRSGVGRFTDRSGHLAFRGGPLASNSDFWHVGGRYYSAGRTMSHSTLHPSRRYAIVLRDLRRSDADTAPPFEEFDARQDATFWYCAR